MTHEITDTKDKEDQINMLFTYKAESSRRKSQRVHSFSNHLFYSWYELITILDIEAKIQDETN